MATLKEHQAAMVDLLANGSGIPASASRLAHAMHDVLKYLEDGRNVPLASVTGVEVITYRPDATTPGLNDKALSKREKALKTDSPAKWPTPAEQRVKELENTVNQLKEVNAEQRDRLRSRKKLIDNLQGDNTKLRAELDTTRHEVECVRIAYDPAYVVQEQAGCRKEDTQAICDCGCPYSHYDDSHELQICNGCHGVK